MLSFANFKSLTRFEQTLFGLPFVFAGAFLPFAEKGFHLTQNPLKLLWILPGFLAARVSGMAFNQLIDRNIDARNPRTKERSLPSGRVTPKEATWVAWGALGVMLFVGAQVNRACLYCAPLVALLLFSYSYMKRLHASCHFVLGMIHFLAPVLAWVAVTGEFAWPPIFLGFAAFFSISGNDILYAFQDYQFDCQEGLHSIPVRFGLKKSLWIGRILYSLVIVSLVLLGRVAHLGWVYFCAPALLASFYYVFHRKKELARVSHQHSSRFGQTVLPDGQSDRTVGEKCGLAFHHFFLLSVATSFTVMIFLAADILWRVLL